MLGLKLSHVSKMGHLGTDKQYHSKPLADMEFSYRKPKHNKSTFGTCILGRPTRATFNEHRFLRNSESKLSKWPWRSRSMTPSLFQYQLRVSHDVCLNLVIPAQICDELSCGQGKVYERQTDRPRQRQYPFGLRGQEVIKPYTYFWYILYRNNWGF